MLNNSLSTIDGILLSRPSFSSKSLTVQVGTRNLPLPVDKLTNINRCDVPTLSNRIGGYNTDTIILARIEGRECYVTDTIPADIRADPPLLHYHHHTVQQRHCVVELVEGAVHRYMSLRLNESITYYSSIYSALVYPHLISP